MKEENPDWVMGFKLVKNQEEATISINHSQYIGAILRWFGMEDCNPAQTPLDSNVILSVYDCPQTDDEKAEMQNVPYRELIGALMWLAVVSQPDIAFAATYLACFNANPGPIHWKAAKHMLRYLKGAIGCQLTLGLHSGNSNELIVYANSDWGCDINNRHSVLGYVFMLGDSAICWSAKKQPTVAVSSTEAKYMSVLHTARQGLWI